MVLGIVAERAETGFVNEEEETAVENEVADATGEEKLLLVNVEALVFCNKDACSICRINSKTSHPLPIAFMALVDAEDRGVAVPETAADAAGEALVPE